MPRKILCEFLSECGEWHALWFGFYSIFFKLRREGLSEELKKDIQREYHYYTLGFFLGKVIIAALAIAGLIFWSIK